MRYLITFTCYGCHLHGDADGSVDRLNNVAGTPVLDADSHWVAWEEKELTEAPYYLDELRREAVLKAIQGVCSYRGWRLLAAHVRATHVHAVVDAEIEPERVMNDFKVYASRALSHLDRPDRKRWARHGSTRWLWKRENVEAAVEYVVAEQGEAMSVFQAEHL